MIARLHVVTDDRILALPAVVARALPVLEAGAEHLALHVRGPRATGALVYEVASALRESASRLGAQLLVNDRVDVALCLDLPGVNLGKRSIPVGAARRLVGPHRLVGASVHDPAAARRAARSSADFLVLGTVFPSASHPDGRGAGVDVVAEVSEATAVPVLAIGGITPERVRGVVEAGAHGVAVLSGIWDAADPGQAVGDYLAALRS